MIFQTYLYAFPNATTPDNILVQTITAIPSLVPGFLMFVWFMVFMGGVSRQKARTGTADYPMWAVVSSLAILILSQIMGIIAGMISLEWTVIIVVLTIFSAVWLFLDKKSNEN